MGALHINGQKATGVNITLAEGVFMDANNTIKALTEFNSSMSYEATEDCFVMIYIVFGSNSMIKIDNKPVANYDGNGNFGISNTFFVKVGQTISVSGASSSYNSYYIVYGIQPGTIEAYAHHYSTEEKVVGTWIDGSTLYEKTYDLGQDVIIKYNEWTEVNATKPNGILKYINIFGTQDDGTGVVLTGANPANAAYSNIRLSTRRFQDESVRWFTIQYTKSS